MKRETGKTPSALQNRVSPPAEWAWYWKGFWRLHGSRQFTFNGPANIPISEIAAYCNLFRINSDEERDFFVTLIQVMDKAYLALVDKRKPDK